MVRSLVFLLALAVCGVRGRDNPMGKCDNNVVTNILQANAADCDSWSGLLGKVYILSPRVMFRVYPEAAANETICAFGNLEQPVNNRAVFRTKFTTADGSIIRTNYTAAEAECGLVFKYVVDENYIAYKLAFTYKDIENQVIGYYACSDEDGTEGRVYGACLAGAFVEEEKQAASLRACAERLKEMTGGDFSVNERCTVEQEPELGTQNTVQSLVGTAARAVSVISSGILNPL